MKTSTPALTALLFAFAVFLFTNVSRGWIFFIGLLIFAAVFAAVHYSYRSR